ncbi:GumC family protein [Chryseobacterium sp. PTM-20240506]|uniref:GumC family protein n=1 Tax=unclassified Chryseobacterium TaxID=2593645 RepID=UPI0023599ED1|nr:MULTISPECIES: tyrosine-protein kinase [unclassified Chryseobacterium]MDC8105109.1 polysaccharide biosynthesis tyrosine autokinase [Chryseobacterium sp. B21-037]MDQ1805366.1 polysaccharide biosynthesis tyrosine autokinase [Chryseobacterium sp. CKR4-1]
MREDQYILKEDSLRDIIQPYIKKWYWFVIGVFIMAILGVLLIKKTTPVFEVLTKILIKDAKKSGNGAADIAAMQGLSGFSGLTSNTVENEMEVLASKKILSQVVNDLPLQCTIYSIGTFHDTELYRTQSPIIIQVINEKPYSLLPKKKINLEINGNALELTSDELDKPIKTFFNKTISLPYANLMIIKNPLFNPKQLSKTTNFNSLYFNYTDKLSTIDNLQEALNVSLSNKEATVINLSLKYENINKAKDILNTLVGKYNNEAITEKNTESEKTKEFIDERVRLISKELGDVEVQKENFKKSNEIVDIASQAGIDLQTGTEAERRKLELYTQLELNNMYINYLNSKSYDEVLPANIGLDNGAAINSISAYNKLITDRNRLLENATPQNPLVKALNDEIKVVRSAIKESLAKSKSNILLTINNVSSVEQKSDSKLKKVPSQERLFRNIERQQQIKEELYLVLLKKREETAITLAMSSDKARVLDLAYNKRKPVAPMKMVILGVAVLLGLAIPFLIIFLKHFFNTRISDKKSIDKVSNIPVIAEIPHLTSKDSNLIQVNDVSQLAEAFRILATNVNLLLPISKEKNRIVLVTSSVKGEGKTFISVNLALSIAKPGKKVLVIGSDIRNPQLQRYKPEMKNAYGLSEFLYGSINKVEDIIHPSGFNPNCDFIFSGIIPPNPVELFENGNYKVLLDNLADKYDYIIIDSAPLMPVTDTFVISKFADVSLYVVRSERTEKAFIEYANNIAGDNKLKNANFVLNDVKSENFGYGNKHGYGYTNTSQSTTILGKLKSFFGKK